MKHVMVSGRDVVMKNKHNLLSQLDLASQHHFVPILVWTWITVCSLAFLSIFHFGLTWLAHGLLFAGVVVTVAMLRKGERQRACVTAATRQYSAASRCVWKLDSES